MSVVMVWLSTDVEQQRVR